MTAPQKANSAQWQPILLVIWGLMVLAAVTFLVVSIVHFGTVISLGPITLDDPFPGAAIPELIIAIVLGVGSLCVLARLPARWRVAFCQWEGTVCLASTAAG